MIEVVEGREEKPVAVLDGSGEDETAYEPIFKYDEMKEDDVVKMLGESRITCIAANEKLIAIGTFVGKIFVMDHFGHVDHVNIPILRPHRSEVSQVVIEEAGNYVMSCGKDFRVAITGLGTKVHNYVLNLPVPQMPRSIALSPSFSSQLGTPMFVVGVRNFTLYEKRLVKWMDYKETVLLRGCEKDGFISKCSWKNDLIAFTNDSGTRIHDRVTGSNLPIIPPKHDIDRIRTSRFPPSHCWASESTLIIGWADVITIIVTNRIHPEVEPTVEVHYCWRLTNMFCTGISYTLSSDRIWDNVVVFGMKPHSEEESDFCDAASLVSADSAMLQAGPLARLFLTVLEPISTSEFKTLADDELEFVPIAPYDQPWQFRMAGLPTCESYFLLSPTKLFVTSPLSSQDTIKWRIRNNQWEQAWELAREKAYELEDSEWDCRSVGRAMIEHYIGEKRPGLAVTLLKEVCGESSPEWEWAVGLFDRERMVMMIAELIPTSNPKLEPECYETILHAALYSDVKLFNHYVHRWNSDLYRAGSIMQLTIRRMQEAECPTATEQFLLTQDQYDCLCRALARLYIYERKFDMALKIYMNLRDPQIFRVIDKYQLFEMVKDQISELMGINTDLALRLLLDNEDSVPASLVMTKIAFQPKLQMAYLTRLFNRNEGSEFADKAVQLFADYDRPRLLPFLRKNEHYNIQKSLDICGAKQYTEEMIFLLGKSGNHIEALDFMMKQNSNIEKAIEYCKEHDDDDLWNHLIDRVVQEPDHVAYMLHNAGSSVDPLRIIEKIPLEMNIPGLKDALAKVLRDCAARVELLRGCRSATYADSQTLLSDFLFTNRKAISIGYRSRCAICGKFLIDSDPLKCNDMRIFGCGHAAHAPCCIESERRQIVEPGACAACSEADRDEFAT